MAELALNRRRRPTPDWVEEFLSRLAQRLRRARVMLILQLLALWPVGRWYAARMTDGSDAPLGALALLAAVGLIVRERRTLRALPRGGLVNAAAAVTLVQAALPDLPDLLRAVLAAGVGIMWLAAVLPRTAAAVNIGFLLSLSLPWIASLEFFAGYPLRVFATESAGGLLGLFGWAVQADGAALRLGDRLMLIDAPCSGIHMLWVGAFMAALASAWSGATPTRLAGNLTLTIALVLLGNILRIAVLFFKETGLLALPDWLHEGIGVGLFVLVLLPIAHLCLRQGDTVRFPASERPADAAVSAGSIPAALMLLSAALLGAGPRVEPVDRMDLDSPEWPSRLREHLRVQVPAQPAEAAWLRRFPGHAAVFRDEAGRDWLLRQVARPTRELHSSADCFRGAGYRLTKAEIRTIEGTRWRCFAAHRSDDHRQVCEQFTDSKAAVWTDVSSWYWDALLERSQAPWTAVTFSTPAAPD